MTDQPRRPAADPDIVADLIRGLLNQVRDGVLDSSPADLARMEGAIVALEIISGGEPADIAARLVRD